MSHIILNFPNQTRVTVEGDEDVVKQVVARLDGMVIEYEERKHDLA